MDLQRLYLDVRQALHQAGFPSQDLAGPGVRVEAVPEGVLVGWQPDSVLLRPAINVRNVNELYTMDTGYGSGIRTAMFTALTAVLELAGFQVNAVNSGLFIRHAAGTEHVAQPR